MDDDQIHTTVISPLSPSFLGSDGNSTREDDIDSLGGLNISDGEILPGNMTKRAREDRDDDRFEKRGRFEHLNDMDGFRL